MYQRVQVKASGLDDACCYNKNLTWLKHQNNYTFCTPPHSDRRVYIPTYAAKAGQVEARTQDMYGRVFMITSMALRLDLVM